MADTFSGPNDVIFKVCLREPEAVNFPGVIIAPGQVLPSFCMVICFTWAMLHEVNFIAPEQVHRHLITTN